MIVLGTELPDLDVADLETAQKIDDFYAKYKDASDKVESEENRVTVIKTVCNAVFSGIDDLFGSGTAKQVFGDKTNMRECMEAYRDITLAINQTQKVLASDINQMVHEMGNRAARRSAKKPKNE